jgi:hypothetical protein
MASLVADTPPLRLVSFVVFGAERLYTRGAEENARLLPLVYPGWTGRFYVGDDVPPAVSEALAAAGSQVVPFARSGWPGRSAQLLRFHPCGEVGVDAVIVRDADSRINPREAAAVREWLASGRRFHFMHEAMHDARYGAVMGGMWGCRRGTGEFREMTDGAPGEEETQRPPVPGLAEAVDAFARGDGEQAGLGAHGDAYGDDMAFLDSMVVPLVTRDNATHHVDGDIGRSLGALGIDGLPRLPFPRTSYRGFVGAPVACRCAVRVFAAAGCGHCSREIPGQVASRLGLAPEALAALGGFLG